MIEEMVRHYRTRKYGAITAVARPEIGGDRDHGGGRMHVGAAFCHRKDQFNRKRGLAIARGRAAKQGRFGYRAVDFDFEGVNVEKGPEVFELFELLIFEALDRLHLDTVGREGKPPAPPWGGRVLRRAIKERSARIEAQREARRPDPAALPEGRVVVEKEQAHG